VAAGLIDTLLALGEDVDALLEELCTDLCHLQSATLTDDGDGGKAETWADVGAALSCVAFPDKPGRLHFKGEVPRGKTPFTIIVRGDVAATSKQRVRIHSTARHTEQIVEVVEVRPTMGVLTEILGLAGI
jgi:hypothetical protein